MDELVTRYQEMVFALQRLNRRLAHCRSKLGEEEQRYRSVKVKAKREGSVVYQEKARHLRATLNQLAEQYKALVDEREALEDRQQLEKERLIERNIEPRSSEEEGTISEALLLLRNFYEALRKGEDVAEEIENLLHQAIPDKPKRLFGRAERLNDLPSQDVFEEDQPFAVLKENLRAFSIEVEDMEGLGVNLVSDSHRRDEFWSIFYAMEQDLKTNQPTDDLIDHLFSLRHRIEVILLDLETSKNHLELDLME